MRFTENHEVTETKDIVRDNDLVNILIAGNPYHSTGLFKDGEIYYYHDSNHTRGEYKGSIEEIAEIIFKNKNSLGPPHKNLISGFIVYSFNEECRTYPKQKELLAKINSSLSKNDLIDGANMACHAGCQKSLDFFKNQEVEPTYGYCVEFQDEL